MSEENIKQTLENKQISKRKKGLQKNERKQ